MSQHLEYTQDKFTFKVATDRLYTAEGIWAKEENNHVTIGVSDFFQQHNGDVAFAEVIEAETAVSMNDMLVNLETIKVDIEILCPISGTIIEVNERLELEAEVINQDPYDTGWLAVIKANDWTAEQTTLMTPEAYFEHMKAQAQKEAGS